MSLRGICKTEFDDESDLESALQVIYGKNQIQIVQNGILINIDDLIGTARFNKSKSGRYELIYDKSDSHRLKDVIPQTLKDKTVVNRLAQEYSRVKVGKMLKTIRGTRIVSEEKDSSTNITRVRAKVRAL